MLYRLCRSGESGRHPLPLRQHAASFRPRGRSRSLPDQVEGEPDTPSCSPLGSSRQSGGGRARLPPKQTCGGAGTCGVVIALGLVPPLGDASASEHKYLPSRGGCGERLGWRPTWRTPPPCFRHTKPAGLGCPLSLMTAPPASEIAGSLGARCTGRATPPLLGRGRPQSPAGSRSRPASP